MPVVLEDLDHYLPVTLHKPDLTEEEWFEFCAKYRDFRIEYTAEGNLILMSGTDFKTGSRNSAIGAQMYYWSTQDRRGGSGDSSTIFLLPSGARRSPDACWISNVRLEALKESTKRIPVMVPEFIIELKSATDSRRELHEKMIEWIEAGVQLAWLIDPERKRVTVYKPGTMPVDFDNLESMAGEAPVEGFVLDLTPVWA
jgi:Uma2 family endonuclease